MVFMQTYTGKKLYFQEPKVEDIDILDIAHGLSNLCRFNGQCDKFYSVAEHSLHVSGQMAGYEGGLAGLLHDASEAYLGDLTSPLKSLLPEYKIIEKRLQGVICQKFGVSQAFYATDVKLVDIKMLATERDQLFKDRILWGSYMDNIKPYNGIPFQFHSPVDAKNAFLEMFNFLMDGR